MIEIDLRYHGDSEIEPGLVDLAVNVRAGTPPLWLAELVRGSIADLGAYPDPSRARAAVAARHGRDPSEVLLTAGAAEAFVLLARVLAPQHAVVVHPQFTEPEAALRAAGHRVSRVILTGGFRLGSVPDGADIVKGGFRLRSVPDDADIVDDGFRLGSVPDEAHLVEGGFRLEAVPDDGDPVDDGFGLGSVPDDADLVMIGNPTNPTSVLHPAASITALARPGRIVVVDEAFMDCVPGEPESLATGAPGVVVVRSLTKTWGLAGLRAGYLLADAALVARLADAQPLWSVSTPALVATEACCSARAVTEAAEWAAQLSIERRRLAAALTALGVSVVPEARASFLCVRISADGLGVRERLRSRGYAVRRGDTFPGLGPDWLRIAVRDAETNDAFVGVLKEVLG